MRVVKNAHRSVDAKDMKDGDIAVIEEHVNSNYIGRVIQRHDSRYISIGMLTGERFPQLLDVRVRILEKGTHLEI